MGLPGLTEPMFVMLQFGLGVVTEEMGNAVNRSATTF